MSDLMLIGVLRMPVTPQSDELTLMQYIDRGRQAADLIEQQQQRIVELEAERDSVCHLNDSLSLERDELAATIERLREAVNKAEVDAKGTVTGYGCELVVDLSKLEHVPEVSCYNNNWYKNHDVFIFVKCIEEYNQVDIYISDKINGDKVFLISDHYNHEGVYSGEVGFEWV